MRLRAARGLLLLALGLLAGCSAVGGTETPDPADSPAGTDPHSSQHETGVVVVVDGGLVDVGSFSILLADGSTLELTPQPGLLFEGGPLSHIRDHLVSGAPVRVEFHQEGDLLIATEVVDSE
ncbi:MAG: hypothetical protein P1T08_06945 [Acidimicrobiia bacterium]|nr:hypothetical protein [Acidimicrobiia bacterium]